MTKKRFIYDGLYVRDMLNKIPSILTHNDKQRDEFLNGLNELSEENEQLKHDATVLICSNQEYRKENEQLKQKNKLLYEDIDFLKRFIEKRGFKAKLESDKR